LNLRSLSAERQMDVCGLCHAGAGTEVTPALSFQPGKRLADYITVGVTAAKDGIDVHGEPS